MWDAFKDLIFACVQFFYNIVGDWGLAIIIITVIFRIIVAPIMHKQSKSSYQMQMMLQNIKNDSKQRNQMLIMGVIMTVMMLWISWGSPAGVLLFWGVSSIFGIAQQQLTNRYLRKADAEREVEEPLKPVEVDVERKVKKQRPKKKR